MPKYNSGRERRRWTESEARRLLAECAASGEPMAAYARAKGVSAQRLSWWRGRLKGWSGSASKRPAELQLIPAEVVHAPAAGSACKVTLRLARGVVVEVTDATAGWIAALVSELEVRR